MTRSQIIANRVKVCEEAPKYRKLTKELGDCETGFCIYGLAMHVLEQKSFGGVDEALSVGGNYSMILENDYSNKSLVEIANEILNSAVYLNGCTYPAPTLSEIESAREAMNAAIL